MAIACTCKGDNRSGTAQLCEQCARKREHETLPPATPDAEAAAFESDVHERGEDSARWTRHIDRLASLFGEAAS